ncbi:MAG: zinc carboxypeptidase, partial [Deltaproteobacteria bacterium]|nr:zinc carboxypeptidase [Deltaproteobacteria bacterium]
MPRIFISVFMSMAAVSIASADSAPLLFHVDVHAPSRAERGEIARMGFDLEGVDLANGIAKLVATIDDVRLLQSMGYAVDYTQADFPSNMADYHNAAETDVLIDDWAADYPDIVHVFSLGDSVEGRPIRVVKISDNADADEDEPGFVLLARHHAREPLSSELALETIRRLVEGYETDPYIEWLVNEREIFVVPRHNPDGAAYDEAQDLVYWRKNRRQNAGQPSECWGVDTNRNYGYQWGLDQGSSGDPCSDVYRGTAAFSEPETALTKAFLEAKTNITTLITLHTYGNMILYPWGYTSSPIGDSTDLAIFQAMAARFRDSNGYTTGPGNSLYPISGDTVDWAYGALGLFAFTFEVSNTDYGFYPPDDIFDITYFLNYPAMEMAAGIAGDTWMARKCGLWLLEGESLGEA